MLAKLVAVDSDGHLQRDFYPHLLKKAGQEIYAYSINIVLATAIYDFCQAGYPDVMQRVMMLRIPTFIKALISDEQGKKEALEFHEAVQNASKNKSH